jgi:hypothetical protein
LKNSQTAFPAFVLVSEIGPGFSPDIGAGENSGLLAFLISAIYGAAEAAPFQSEDLLEAV